MDYNDQYNTYRATDTGRWVRVQTRRDERGTIFWLCPMCGAEDHEQAWVLTHMAAAGHDTDPGV